jgi:hypothetical protein
MHLSSSFLSLQHVGTIMTCMYAASFEPNQPVYIDVRDISSHFASFCVIFVLVRYEYLKTLNSANDLRVFDMFWLVFILCAEVRMAEVSTNERIRLHCSVCGTGERKPHIRVFVCKIHGELRCKHCIRNDKHTIQDKQHFARCGDSVFKIKHSVEEKEVNGGNSIIHSNVQFIFLSTDIIN